MFVCVPKQKVNLRGVESNDLSRTALLAAVMSADAGCDYGLCR